jgi:hypothetical protein
MLTREQKALRRGIAYHEAGHAVVAWILGQRISSIRIYAESNREALGLMRCKKEPYSFRALRMLDEASESCPDIEPAMYIVVAFAGMFTQLLVEPNARWARVHVIYIAASGDWLKINELLAAMNCTDEQRTRRLELLSILCIDYIGRHLEQIADLAEALLANGRILKAKEIRQILGPRTMPLRKAIEDVRLVLQGERY